MASKFGNLQTCVTQLFFSNYLVIFLIKFITNTIQFNEVYNKYNSVMCVGGEVTHKIYTNISTHSSWWGRHGIWFGRYAIWLFPFLGLITFISFYQSIPGSVFYSWVSRSFSLWQSWGIFYREIVSHHCQPYVRSYSLPRVHAFRETMGFRLRWDSTALIWNTEQLSQEFQRYGCLWSESSPNLRISFP